MSVSVKLNMCIYHNPRILLLGLYPRIILTHVNKETCTRMPVIVLSINGKLQTTSLPTKKGKLCFIHIIEFYTTAKNKNLDYINQH